MKVDVISKNGQPAGRQIELPDDIFGIDVNEHVLYLAVKQYRAGQRSGTHKAKERAEIVGSTRKIKKQKGTGTARAGSIKSPLFRGGGRIFGPRPRKYKVDLNKKVAVLAQKSALSSKVASDGLKVIENFDLEAPKTKGFVDVLKGFELDGKKSLLIMSEIPENVQLSSRNIEKALVSDINALNVYDIMNANTVILSESAVEAIKEKLS